MGVPWSERDWYAAPMHVFIAIPSAGLSHAWFAQSLARMVTRATREGVCGPDGKRVQPVITTHVEVGKLPMVRNKLMKLAIESGASHCLWLDDDHVFPDWTLARLMLAGREVVGINQPTRSKPHLPTASSVSGERNYGGQDLAKQGLIEQVGSVGFAVVLMQMGIVAKLEASAKERGRSLFPLFDFTLSDDPDVAGGEDAFFCARCREAGIDIHVDHMTSWATWHIAELPVGMKEAMDDRPAVTQRKTG